MQWNTHSSPCNKSSRKFLPFVEINFPVADFKPARNRAKKVRSSLQPKTKIPTATNNIIPRVARSSFRSSKVHHLNLDKVEKHVALLRFESQDEGFSVPGMCTSLAKMSTVPTNYHGQGTRHFQCVGTAGIFNHKDGGSEKGLGHVFCDGMRMCKQGRDTDKTQDE